MPLCGGKLRQHHAGRRDVRGWTTGIRWHSCVVQEMAPKGSWSKRALAIGTFLGVKYLHFRILTPIWNNDVLLLCRTLAL